MISRNKQKTQFERIHLISVIAQFLKRSLRRSVVLIVLCAIPHVIAARYGEVQQSSDASRAKMLESETPLDDRIGLAPESFLKQFEGEAGGKVAAHVVTPAERTTVADALSHLTPVQREVLRSRLHAISFVDGMPNNALTYPADEQAAQHWYNITIRAGAIHETVSELVTHKEQTLFDTTNSDMSISVDAGTLNALVYVLLHEATHIVDGSLGLTPDGPGTSGYSPLLRDVWRDRLTPVDRYRQSILMDIRYRRNGRVMPISMAPDVYDALGRTPFISLYGSSNWHDDLAEMVAWTELTRHLHQPYKITIWKGVNVLRVIEPAKSKLVQARLKYVDQLTGN